MHLIVGRLYKIVDVDKESIYFPYREIFKEKMVRLDWFDEMKDSDYLRCNVTFQEKFAFTFNGKDGSETKIHIDSYTGDPDDSFWVFDGVELEEIKEINNGR